MLISKKLPCSEGQSTVPWARAVPPGGGSTALLLFYSCSAEEEKQIFSFHSCLVPVAEILSGRSLKFERAAALKDAYCK